MFTRVRDDRIARGFQICNTRRLGRSVLVADFTAGELSRINKAVDHPRRHDEQIGGLLCCYRFVRRHITSDAYRVIPLLPDSQHSAGIPPPVPGGARVSLPAVAAVSSRNRRMVDAHVLDGHFQPALCQLVGLIDEFCAHAETPLTAKNVAIALSTIFALWYLLIAHVMANRIHRKWLVYVLNVSPSQTSQALQPAGQSAS